MNLMGYNLETSEGRQQLLSLVNRWTLAVLILGIFTMLSGIVSSILLFLGGSSSKSLDQVVGALNIVLVLALLIILIVIWVYFEKFKNNFALATRQKTPVERFEANTEQRFREVSAERNLSAEQRLRSVSAEQNQPVVIQGKPVSSVDEFIRNANDRHADLMRSRKKAVVAGSNEEKVQLIE